MASNRFGHLRGIAPGTKDKAVAVSLHDYTPPKKRDFVPNGNYKVTIVDSDMAPAGTGSGTNMRVSYRIAEPQEFAGRVVEDLIWMPYDDVDPEPKSKDGTLLSDIAYKKIQHLLRSIASEDPGKVEALQQLGEDGKPKFAPICPAKIIGRTAFVETERGDANVMGKDGKTRDFSNTSKVRWMIGREDFEKAKGPFPETAPGAQQKSEPELGAQQQQQQQQAPQNGTKTAQAPAQAQGGQASVGSMVGF